MRGKMSLALVASAAMLGAAMLHGVQAEASIMDFGMAELGGLNIFSAEIEHAQELLTLAMNGSEFKDVHDMVEGWNKIHVDESMSIDDLSTDARRMLLGNGGKLLKFVPSELQIPRWRWIKELTFFKRYTLAAACQFTMKIFGKPPPNKLFECSTPKITSAFCLEIPLNIPIGPLTFPFDIPLCLPDLSGLENILRFLNGDLGAIVAIVLGN